MNYFEEKHISAHTRIKLLNRCVMVSSFGKSFHVTGWKVGYLVARIFNEKKSTSVSGFQCQQSMPGSNKRVLDVVSVDGIGMYKRKRLLQKAFRNKSVQTPAL
jgi:methionine aminotransferase